jgi:dihydroorotase
MRTLIKNATCVLPNTTTKASVLIEGTKILAIDPPASALHHQTIDASGLHLLPGVIDDQVHFREPGLTHKEDLRTASLACAKGGVTSFFEMPNTNPQTITVDRLHEKLALASTRSLVNYAFYIGATLDNVDQLQKATRTPGIKIFIGSSTGNMLVDEQAVLESIFKNTTLPICAHCEDETTVRNNTARLQGGKTIHDHSKIRDHAAALIATKRACDLAIRHKHRFHVLHVSTAAEIPVILNHHKLITAEVCPHHLFFSVDDYDRLGTLIQMNPSVKFKEDNHALWLALLDNSIQVIATDHAPHTLEEKAHHYPKSHSGLPAVENSLALMLNQAAQGHCTLQQIAAWMSDAPARVWDAVNKGRIAEGFDADLVLVDMSLKQTILNHTQMTKVKWSPWHGQTLTGWPVQTFVMGHKVFDRGAFDLSQMGHEITFDHSRNGYWN